VPFIGPIVFAWLALIAGVMGSYVLLVYRQGRPKNEEYLPDWSRSKAAASRPANEPLAPAWAQPARPVVPVSTLPAYDMEEFPEDRWGTAQMI